MRRELPWWKRMPLWAWELVLLLAVGSASWAAAWLPRYTTSNPEYCLTCHGENGGLPNRGIASLVHPPLSEVRCVDCHSKPHQLLYEGYRQGFMAEPDRVGPNCLRCHEEMAGRVDETGFKFNALQIRIPHKLHVELGTRCTDCHLNIAHDLRSSPTNRPQMGYCAQCHAVTVESCSKCHPAGLSPTMRFELSLPTCSCRPKGSRLLVRLSLTIIAALLRGDPGSGQISGRAGWHHRAQSQCHI